jgi:hypothetical protein
MLAQDRSLWSRLGLRQPCGADARPRETPSSRPSQPGGRLRTMGPLHNFVAIHASRYKIKTWASAGGWVLFWLAYCWHAAPAPLR